MNMLSDSEPNELQDFNAFGNLLVEGDNSPVRFYCVMVVPSGSDSVKIAHGAYCNNADELNNWLCDVDALVAKKYSQLRFKGFVGGYSRVNNEFAVEANFQNKPSPRSVSSYKVIA
ncbi:hypothetical protein [Escherichia coli]|uniref:hypothetical protein n=1 Tax=Escherichia coli TaxID=562 RepID=UPI00184136C5|nr:hypothetical protein [Escherichia coli]EFM6520594.1 hypothetical protein [Escherichia coli]EIV9095344.1 hypothetical protein [Escherichia coli]HCL9682435.1 hypothetical protein [Escherichia coli]